MRIDWFTVIAQLLNFLILVWLLKRFLYKPILRAIDAREQRIADALSDADARQREADEQRETYRKKNEAFDQQRSALLGEAQDEAKTERRHLLDQARKDADALRAKQRDTLQHEQESLQRELMRRTREEVFAIARRTLADLAGTSLEASMSEAFTRRLREMDRETKELLAQALKMSTEPARVRSAFALSPDQQGAIQGTLKEVFATDVNVRFETASEVVSGIEFSVNGQKIVWSIEDYLLSLEESVEELLKEQAP